MGYNYIPSLYWVVRCERDQDFVSLVIIQQGDVFIFQVLAIHDELICFEAAVRLVFHADVIHRFAETIIQLVFGPVFRNARLDL